MLGATAKSEVEGWEEISTGQIMKGFYALAWILCCRQWGDIQEL